MQEICDDLDAEQQVLDDIVSSLSEDEWLTPTPAEGWNIRDQIGHLAYFEERALVSITAEASFAESTALIVNDAEAFDDETLAGARSSQPEEVLASWRMARAATLRALLPLDPSRKLLWYGPPMGARTFATARLMETWAHGQDVVDALGVQREPTDRLRHVAHLGVRTFAWSYRNRGLDPPVEPVRVELFAPSGEVWTWNELSPEVVWGSAEDFCLVVTQRRHFTDTLLVAEGPAAEEWMEIAQAFAGPPGPGRKPGQFKRNAQ